MPWGPSFLTFAKICFLPLDLQAAYEIPVLTLEHCAVKHKTHRVNSLQVRCLNQLRNNLKDRIKLTYKALKKPSKWLPLLCPLVGGGFLWSISSVLDGVGLGCLLLPGVWLLSGFLFAAFLLAQFHCRLLVFWTLFALLAHRFTFSCGNWPLCGVWCLKQFQTMVIFRGKCKHFGRRSINIFRNERPPGREKSCCPTGFRLQISWLTPAALTQGSTPRELTVTYMSKDCKIKPSLHRLIYTRLCSSCFRSQGTCMQRCTVTGMHSHCYSPSFCIPSCASTQKVLGKGLGEDGSKRRIKQKIKNVSTKRNAPSKIKNIGNST